MLLIQSHHWLESGEAEQRLVKQNYSEHVVSEGASGGDLVDWRGAPEKGENFLQVVVRVHLCAVSFKLI